VEHTHLQFEVEEKLAIADPSAAGRRPKREDTTSEEKWGNFPQRDLQRRTVKGGGEEIGSALCRGGAGPTGSGKKELLGRSGANGGNTIRRRHTNREDLRNSFVPAKGFRATTVL